MTMTITNEFLKCELGYVLDDNNSPWFSGKGVGIALGYKDTNKALKDHVDDDDKEKRGNLKVGETFTLANLRVGVSPILTFNQKNTIYINESGLYSLIMSSKLPSKSFLNGSLRKYYHQYATHNRGRRKTVKT